MYFTKVELHNYGIYKGTHEMVLTNKVGDRNIILVGGLNGRGKTTFHDAILLALYGKQALKYINEKARSYDKLLLDHINKHAKDKETYIAVSLCLDDGTSIVDEFVKVNDNSVATYSSEPHSCLLKCSLSHCIRSHNRVFVIILISPFLIIVN